MDHADSKNGKRMMFSEDAFQKIKQVLAELTKRANAHLCVFADVNGYPIGSYSITDDVDISSLTALAAGTFSATAAMANLISGEQQFKYIYHEGTHRNIYLCNVSSDYLIIVVFDKSVPLGLIRVLTHHTIARLNEVIRLLETENEKAVQFLDLEFKSLLSKELNRSFGI
jgi:predicted regulator of Ras-like GTPase activity (Roadblock/LC7/MglB family)